MRNPNRFHSVRFIVEQIAMLSQHVPRSGEIGSRQCRGQSHPPLFQTLQLEIVNPHRSVKLSNIGKYFGYWYHITDFLFTD